jgi:hypothetical protein
MAARGGSSVAASATSVGILHLTIAIVADEPQDRFQRPDARIMDGKSS